MLKPRAELIIIILILALAAILRLGNLTSADVITDESLIAFRSIGLIDFLASPNQTTPWEWFSDNIPWWAKISFHDHPPLVFIIQYLFFSIFGVSIIILRLPFAVAGIIGVYLLYLIGQKLFNKQVGIIASLLLAVLGYHIWISRVGLQESIVILFSLLAFYYFVLALNNGKHYYWGIALGLAMMTKYTAGILFLIFVVYLLLTKREVFLKKNFWLAVLLAVVIFSPVLIYNLKLYQATGHFDLQFSYLFGQHVAEWQSLPGKEQAGDLFDRTKNIIPSLYQGLLWPMFILLTISFFYGVYCLVNEKEVARSSIFLLILAIIFYLLLFLIIGPAKRFVATVVPFIILLIAWFIDNLSLNKTIKYLGVLALVLVEIFFVGNTLFIYYPLGKLGLTYSYLKTDSYNWGYNQLGGYLDNLLINKTPEITFETRYPFLEDLKKKALAQAKNQNKKSWPILLIYDSDMYDLSTLWLFHRRMIYEGWPVIPSNDYLAETKDFWQQQGVKDFYFFKIIDETLVFNLSLVENNSQTEFDQQINNLTPEIIKRPDGREVFAVYHWQ